MRTSPVMREYLAEIYRVASYQPQETWVSTSALAERMSVSPAAVARMVTRLKERGLLEHEPYQGMCLTPAGRHEALHYLRRHRLTETFLVRVMGFGWHEVHSEADAIGPTLSDQVAERMNRMAGHPRRCPHGEPIPSAEGHMPIVVDEVLAALEPPASLVISRVNTDDPGKLIYLESLGLLPGHAFELRSRGPFEGPLRLRIGEGEHMIGVELASVLRVCAPGEFDLDTQGSVQDGGHDEIPARTVVTYHRRRRPRNP
ncbi:MAG: metal-dependent transcriptional regulator [Anaerolineae bacterium]|nr:metal-dependent transcriptional regulator [Anaerolineae bacterium]